MTSAHVISRGTGRQMRTGDNGKRILTILEPRLAVFPIKQLGNREAQAQVTAAGIVVKTLGTPVGSVIRQHGEAGNRMPVAVIEPVVVDEHPFGKFIPGLALDLDMHIEPSGVTALPCDPHQTVDEALA